MKNGLLKSVSVGLLSLALTIVAFDQHAAAQFDQTDAVITDTADDGFDWGLLGLLGLLGLGGLMRGERSHTTHRDTAASAGNKTTRT